MELSISGDSGGFSGGVFRVSGAVFGGIGGVWGGWSGNIGRFRQKLVDFGEFGVFRAYSVDFGVFFLSFWGVFPQIWAISGFWGG